MKRIITILFGALALGGARADIIFQAEPPAVPDKVPVVQVSRWPMSYLTFQRRAISFDMQGEPLKTPRGLTMRSGPFVFQQDMMGSEFFANTDLIMAEPPGEAAPLDDAVASRMASEFLRKHTGGVNIDEVQLQRVAHLFNQGQDLRSGEITKATQDESIVYFRRLIGGIPVVPEGDAGDHVSVHIANTGQVVGQHKFWRNARLTGDGLPVRPFDEAKREIIGVLTQELGQSQAYDAIITRIEFGLYARPEGQPQGYYQPAYLFHVLLFDKESKDTTGARLIAIAGTDPKLLREPLDLPHPPSEVGSRENIKFQAQMPQLPSALPAVQIEPVKLSSDMLLSRGALLGLKQGRISETPRGLGLSDGRLLLFEDQFGTELFSDTERMMAEKPGEAAPIPDRDALALANRYVAGLQDTNEGELGTPIVRHLMHQTFDTAGQKPGDPTQDETIVEFPRILRTATGAPIPCIGPGAFLQVHVDNLGNVTGHHRVWRPVNLQTMEPIKLRDVETVQDDFLRQVLSELGTSLANVTNIQFGLYFRGEGMPQGFAQPAVLFDVDIIDPATGQTTAHRQIPIPAAPDLLEPLTEPDAQFGLDDPNLQGARSVDEIPKTFGDINDDGKVDLVDVAACIQYAGGLGELASPASLAAGDVAPAGGNDQVDLSDALRILRSVFQLDDISNGP